MRAALARRHFAFHESPAFADMTAVASPSRASGLPSSQETTIAPRRRVRVLFINDTARNGGPGRSLHSILKFLDRSVVHRAVVLPRAGAVSELLIRDGVADELLFEPHLVENPIEPWNRPMERRDFDAPPAVKAARLAGNVFKGASAMVRLARLIRRGRYDLIYCNGTNADFAGGALAQVAGVPALWHVRYTSLPSAVVGLHRRLSGSEGVRRVVCVSRSAAALFPHCAEKVTVVHNALDVDSFDPALVRPSLRGELGLPEGAVVFGSHGRVLRRKGYIEMVRAARLALDRMSDDLRARVLFVVVGDTPEDFRPDHVAECRALAEQLGLGDRFRMLGFRSDVRPLVADFDVAVVPSVYADPLPRSVIESMALAKPVVAYDVGGVVEMLQHGVTGELVHFEAAEAGANAESIGRLADALVRYASDPQLRARQGRAARERVVLDFDARAHARRIQGEIVRAAGLSLDPA
jgi:glycosyltransferase involved in cell wall biosynthesis